MPRVDDTSFDRLRTWNGEQSRAFEEVAFQLLKYQVPAGTRAIRTGNPDGGVEWYATLSDGTEWGWQAKHVHGIDALLTAMTGSVGRVAMWRSSGSRIRFPCSSRFVRTSTRRPSASICSMILTVPPPEGGAVDIPTFSTNSRRSDSPNPASLSARKAAGVGENPSPSLVTCSRIRASPNPDRERTTRSSNPSPLHSAGRKAARSSSAAVETPRPHRKRCTVGADVVMAAPGKVKEPRGIRAEFPSTDPSAR